MREQGGRSRPRHREGSGVRRGIIRRTTAASSKPTTTRSTTLGIGPLANDVVHGQGEAATAQAAAPQGPPTMQAPPQLAARLAPCASFVTVPVSYVSFSALIVSRAASTHVGRTDRCPIVSTCCFAQCLQWAVLVLSCTKGHPSRCRVHQSAVA